MPLDVRTAPPGRAKPRTALDDPETAECDRSAMGAVTVITASALCMGAAIAVGVVVTLFF
jgi:hypothetical protein